MADADKLVLYNDALLLCGERFIASLTEEREPRRLLDQVWASGAVDRCLEEGQWHFAMRTVELDYDTSLEPAFGYNRAFAKPDDWVLTSAVCSDEFFRSPLTRYTDEERYWYSDLDTIYVRYVSNDADYGNDLARWPKSFHDFVAAHMASRIVNKLTNSEEERARVIDQRKKALSIAKNRAAMAEPTSFASQGSWGRARNRFPNRRDGGNTSGNLIP